LFSSKVEPRKSEKFLRKTNIPVKYKIFLIFLIVNLQNNTDFLFSTSCHIPYLYIKKFFRPIVYIIFRILRTSLKFKITVRLRILKSTFSYTYGRETTLNILFKNVNFIFLTPKPFCSLFRGL